MSRHEIKFSTRSLDQLAAQQDFIENGPTQSAALAEQFAERLVRYIERNLALMPLQGQQRDDIQPGLRTTHYRGSTIIAFTVNSAKHSITIHGLFFGGQNFEGELDDLAED